MAAVLTPAAATVVINSNKVARRRDVYEGRGSHLAKDPSTMNTDYGRMHAALVLVKGDAAYASLDAATKTAVDALGVV